MIASTTSGERTCPAMSHPVATAASPATAGRPGSVRKNLFTDGLARGGFGRPERSAAIVISRKPAIHPVSKAVTLGAFESTSVMYHHAESEIDQKTIPSASSSSPAGRARLLLRPTNSTAASVTASRTGYERLTRPPRSSGPRLANTDPITRLQLHSSTPPAISNPSTAPLARDRWPAGVRTNASTPLTSSTYESRYATSAADGSGARTPRPIS